VPLVPLQLLGSKGIKVDGKPPSTFGKPPVAAVNAILGTFPEIPAMTGNLAAIGFIASWVLAWGIGGSLIDAGLIQAGVYSLESGQLGTLATFAGWTLAWGAFGVWLYNRLTGPAPPQG
jgi:hypothetical protein